MQGAHYEDLRRQACRGLESIVDENGLGFDGYGIGGALEKQNLATIVGWCTEELPDQAPSPLGISEPDDLFAAIEAGADTFDCVSPSRVARNAALYFRQMAGSTSPARVTGAIFASRSRLRLLHLRPLHPRLSAPPVQGQGDPAATSCNSQRALHHSAVDTIRDAIVSGDLMNSVGKSSAALQGRSGHERA